MYKVKVKCHINNYHQLYLLLWQGTLQLTSTETDVLLCVLKSYLALREDVKEPHTWSILFSTEYRRKMQEELGFSPQRFNNYVKYLKDKGVLVETNGGYRIDEKLIPRENIHFEFDVRK